MTRKSDNLVSLLAEASHRDGDKVLYSILNRKGMSTETLTYRDLYQNSNMLAASLLRKLNPRDCVVLLYPHGMSFIKVFFSCIAGGLVPMPMTKPRGEEWKAVYKLLLSKRARAILSTKIIIDQLREEDYDWNGLELICTDELLSGSTPDEAFEKLDFLPKPEDTAFIQYTSGSTSSPKGVEITHKNVLHNSKFISDLFEHTRADVGATWLPFHHDMGLIGHVIQPLYVGIPNYFISPMSFAGNPSIWFKIISDYGVTITGGPNFGYDLCLNKVSIDTLTNLNLSSWRVAYCGSERVSEITLRKFADSYSRLGFNAEAIYPCYGMAESTLFVCGRHGLELGSLKGNTQNYVSVGRTTHPEVSIKIVDSMTLVEKEDGEWGEICIASESIAKGYYHDKQETAKTFVRLDKTDRTYLLSGDTGFISDENLFISGRIKNTIKVRGVTIHAEDIEHTIYSMNLRRVLKCAAFADLDSTHENIVILVEFRHFDQVEENSIVLDKIAHVVCDKIGVVPSIVRGVAKNTLPLTTSGKLKRNEVRKVYRNL
jgi:acyl-CoA synthetase (AMP-forming)/AMP-acid ligase II